MGRDLELEIAWAAGIIEGEGWIGTIKQKDSVYPVVSVDMTDEDIVKRLRDLLGGGFSGPFRNERSREESYDRKSYTEGRNKPRYRWSCCGTRARRVLGLIAPYLGERRSLRMQEVLDTSTTPKRVQRIQSKGEIDVLLDDA